MMPAVHTPINKASSFGFTALRSIMMEANSAL